MEVLPCESRLVNSDCVTFNSVGTKDVHECPGNMMLHVVAVAPPLIYLLGILDLSS